MAEMIVTFVLILALLLVFAVRAHKQARIENQKTELQIERPTRFKTREGDSDARSRSRKVKLVYRDNPFHR